MGRNGISNMGLGIDMASIGLSKQGEIREGIDRVIQHWNPTASVSADWTPLYGGASVGQDVQLYLHSQGCVIKVDRELPDCECCERTGLIGGSGINDCCPECNGTGKKFSVGYVAVESLIKEE